MSQMLVFRGLPRQSIYDTAHMIALTPVFRLTHHPFRECIHNILNLCIAMRRGILWERCDQVRFEVSSECFNRLNEIQDHTTHMRELLWVSTNEYDVMTEDEDHDTDEDENGDEGLSIGEVWAGGIPRVRARRSMHIRCDKVIDSIFEAVADEHGGSLTNSHKIFEMLRKINDLSSLARYLLAFPQTAT